jgi:hypothetical protein
MYLQMQILIENGNLCFLRNLFCKILIIYQLQGKGKFKLMGWPK